MRSQLCPRLPRIQLDDQLFVDDGLHFLAGGNVGDFAFERVAIDGQPVGDGDDLGQVEVADDELTRFWFVFDRDLVTGLNVVGRDVDGAAVHDHVPVGHELSRGAAGIGKAEPENDVVDPRFEKLEQRLAGHAALAQRVLENAAELTLE